MKPKIKKCGVIWAVCEGQRVSAYGFSVKEAWTAYKKLFMPISSQPLELPRYYY